MANSEMTMTKDQEKRTAGEPPPDYSTAASDASMLNGVSSAGVLVLARVRRRRRREPEEEQFFVQVLLPVALSYETFLCKLCVALGLDGGLQSVAKVVKLPDVLIRSTEDVVRLRNGDKLELRLKKPPNVLLASVKATLASPLCHALLLLAATLAYTWFYGQTPLSQQQQQINVDQLLAALEQRLAKAKHGPDQPSEELHRLAKELKLVLSDVSTKMDRLERHATRLSDRSKELNKLVNSLRTALEE